MEAGRHTHAHPIDTYSCLFTLNQIYIIELTFLYRDLKSRPCDQQAFLLLTEAS